MRRTPALIVGGGPAGAAAAIVLAQAGASHLLVERARGAEDAICGGFLSWRTLDTLRALGVDPDDLNPADVTRLRLLAGQHHAETMLPRPAKAVSRRRLDAALRDVAEMAGAAIEHGVMVRAIDGLDAHIDGGATIAADTVFLASGKHDIRGLARRQATRDPTLGLRVRIAASPAARRLIGDAIELHLFDRGYAGVVLQEDGSANLCLAVRRSRLREAGDPAALFAALGRASPHLRDRLALAETLPAIDAIANVPYGWRQTTGARGLFLLGDQAGVIPSLAGEGMGIALASGRRAAAAYLTGGAGGSTGYQARLAVDIRRPIAIAQAVWHIAETRAGGAMLPPLARGAPALTRLIARLTRVDA